MQDLPPLQDLLVSPLSALLAVAGVLLAAFLFRRSRITLPEDGYPDDLAGCEIVMIEGSFVGRYARHNKPGRKVMVCRRPRHLSGMPDLAVRRGRTVIPVEWKKRRHGGARDGDIVQLSVYRALLAAHPATRWLRVADRGFVGTLDTEGQPNAWTAVDLLSNRELATVVDHYLDCVAGREEPRTAPPGPGICRACPARSRCPL